MEIPVFLFAGARQRLGRSTVTVELPDGATVSDLRDALAAAHPELENLLTSSRIALNAEYGTNDRIVAEGDEVALIPPVSGGSSGSVATGPQARATRPPAHLDDSPRRDSG